VRRETGNGVNFVGGDTRRYCRSSTASTRRYLRIVLRDSPVARTISRTDFFCRRCIRRTLPIISMVIILLLPRLLKKAAG